MTRSGRQPVVQRSFFDRIDPLHLPINSRKFVLTLRDSASWIKSQVRHLGPRETPLRKWIYGAGSPLGNEAIYIRRFEAHNAEVLEYFRRRPNDLLVMRLAAGYLRLGYVG